MSECTNVTCTREATTDIYFAGVGGPFGYCDDHAEELQELEEME